MRYCALPVTSGSWNSFSRCFFSYMRRKIVASVFSFEAFGSACETSARTCCFSSSSPSFSAAYFAFSSAVFSMGRL